MKKILLLVALIATVALGATEPPKFLDGVRYRVDTEVDALGDTFEVYVIDGYDAILFKSKTKGLKRLARYYRVVKQVGIISFVVYKWGDYEIMESRTRHYYGTCYYIYNPGE